MIVFHGSTLEIKTPDIMHSKGNLDFGVGFHVSETLNIFVGQMIDNVNQL